MAQTICILLDAEDRTRLAAIVGDRNRPYKLSITHNPGQGGAELDVG